MRDILTIKEITSKLLNYISKPSRLYLLASSKSLTRFVPDRIHLQLSYRIIFGRRLDLDNPRTFSEKLQWLKLHNRNPLYTLMVDKYRAKEFIASKVGFEHVVPNLAVWDSPECIDLLGLPDKFVLKTNHDCGGVVICTDKATFDLESAKVELRRHLAKNYYYGGREWPYRDVKPLVFAEKFLDDFDSETNESADGWEGIDEYDFLCFNGEPKLIAFCHGDKTDPSKRCNDYYNCNWDPLEITCGYEACGGVHRKPKQLDEMLLIARELSKGIPFLRVDLFVSHGVVLVGELTFFPWGGFTQFQPFAAECELGEWIDLTLACGVGSSK